MIKPPPLITGKFVSSHL